jgi:hypothetical protein
VELVEAEQADAECLERLALVTHQRHAGGDLDARLGEARNELRIIAVADDHARCLEAVGGNTGKAVFREHGSDPPAEFPLFFLDLFQAIGLDYLHHVAQRHQAISGESGVVGMAAFLVSFPLCQPRCPVVCGTVLPVWHPFHVVKNLFRHRKVRYRGLLKNTA